MTKPEEAAENIRSILDRNKELEEQNQKLWETLQQIRVMVNNPNVVTPLKSAKPHEIFARPIGTLELSWRPQDRLGSAKIYSIGELVTKTEADLLKLPTFGRTSLREVKRKLEGLSLRLNMTEEEIVAWTAPPPPFPGL